LSDRISGDRLRMSVRHQTMLEFLSAGLKFGPEIQSAVNLLTGHSLSRIFASIQSAFATGWSNRDEPCTSTEENVW